MHFYNTRSTLKVAINGASDPPFQRSWRNSEAELDLKIINSLEDQTAEGREFHVFGPETDNIICCHPYYH